MQERQQKEIEAEHLVVTATVYTLWSHVKVLAMGDFHFSLFKLILFLFFLNYTS